MNHQVNRKLPIEEKSSNQADLTVQTWYLLRANTQTQHAENAAHEKRDSTVIDSEKENSN